MKRAYRILLVAAVYMFLITVVSGCWDLKDINQKLIVTALGFDYKDDEIWFYLEISNTELGSSSERQSVEGSSERFVTYKSHGKTLSETRDDLDEKLDKPLYLSGARTLVFTESFANKYLVEYLYRFRADETYRKQSICVITKENPEELFNKVHEMKESFGIYIEGEFETLEEMHKFFPRTIGRVIENISNVYSGILLPCIGIDDELPSIIGYSVLNGPQVTGFIPSAKNRTDGLMFLKADKPKLVYTVPYKEMIFTVEAKLKKRKLEPFYSGGEISMNLTFDISAEIMYGDKKTPYNLTEADMQNMSGILADLIKNDITGTIEQAQQEFNCDYLQFDDAFRIKYPEEFDSMQWQDMFSKIHTSVDVKADITMQYGLDYGPNEVG